MSRFAFAKGVARALAGSRGLVAIPFALAAAVSAQQAPPTFRTGVEAVAVDAFVTDRQGNPVRNLTIDDFEIFEDSKPQRITSFAEVNIPIEPPAPYTPATIEPDVATNSGGDGRLYAIVLDELQAVGGAGGELTQPAAFALRARQFLHTFIEQHFEVNDVGIVVSVGRARAVEMQDFTSSRRLLLKAIDTYAGGFPVPEPPPGADTSSQDGPTRPGYVQIRAQARALRDLMESLERIRGRRKTVIYITGEVGDSSMSTIGRANVWDVIDYKAGVRSLEFDDLRAAMTAAMRGGIAFYPLDPYGADPTLFGADNLERMDGLRKLAAATGGFAVTNSNGFAQAFPRIVAENSNYYVLGFTSSNEKRDGRYRTLKVQMKRPDLAVRFRDGYIGPSKTSDAPELKARAAVTLSAGIGDSIASPVANGAVPMRVFAAAYRSASRNANVVITAELDPTRLNLLERESSINGVLEVAAVAVSAAGKVAGGHREQFTLALKPDTWSKTSTAGIRVITGMALPPGRYQLRVAGGNVAFPKAGSVMYDLDVPDFSKPALALSALSLASRGTEAALALPSKSVRPVVPHAPIAIRDFAADDTLWVYGELYDNKPKEAHRLDVTAELRDGDGRRVGRAVTESRADGKPVQMFEAALPLDVPAGSYTLHVEARSTNPKQGTVSRDVPIRVTEAGSP